jgi:predicted small integral membrane protein
MLERLANIDFAWMAWTWQTGLFFTLIAAVLALMTLLAIWFPEVPRVGVLRIPTTRGDRLFVFLLGSALICLLWISLSTTLGAKDASLWWAVAICAVYGGAVFRFV